MSGSYASNTVDQTTKVMTQISLNATQTCQSSVTENELIEFNNDPGANIKIGSITGQEAIVTNLKCAQSDTVNQNIKNDIDETIGQIAKAITQGLSITPAVATSINNSDVYNKLGIAIADSFTQTCSQKLQENQSVIMNNDAGSNIVIGSIDFKQSENAVLQCIQKDSAVVAAANDLKTMISQSATSKEESLLGPLLAIILIIVVIIIAITGGGIKALTNWKFLLTIAFIIGGYFLLAAWQRWWPFRSS